MAQEAEAGRKQKEKEDAEAAARKQKEKEEVARKERERQRKDVEERIKKMVKDLETDLQYECQQGEVAVTWNAASRARKAGYQ